MDYDLMVKIATPILAIITGLLAYIWNNQNKELKEMKNKVESVEKNYLHRFEEVNKNINEGFTELKVLFAQYSTKLDNLIYAHNEAIKNNTCPVQIKHREE